MSAAVSILIRCSLVLLLLLAATLTADDWPQWRGPDRNDVSREGNLLDAWPAEGPLQVWLFRNCGLGYSGPAVVGNRLYTQGARDDAELLICLNVDDGSELWTAKVGDVLTNNWGDGPRGTPTVDGDRVYALSGQGNLICARASDGGIVWQLKLQDFGGETPGWGYTESVLIDGPRLVCTPGGDQGTLLALDKLTGERLWQSTEVTDDAQYASPIAAQIHGLHQVIQLTESQVLGINAETGALIWRADWPGSTAVIPTPIYRDSHVYVTSGYGAGCNLLRIEPNQQSVSVYDEEARKLMKNQHGGVVLVGDHLYGYSDSVGWICQEWSTGKPVWRERDALGKGCLTYADGMLYCLSEDEGIVALVRATPDGWQEVSRFALSPQSEVRSPSGAIWTHPVVANGRLYLRDQDLLFCFNVQDSSL